MRMMIFASAILSSLLTTSVGAEDSNGAKLTVEHAWARASAGTTAAAYFRVLNQGSAGDRLLAVGTPVADKAAIHENKMENGVMKMRPIGPITIAPGQSIVLKPGADHVMLIGLKHPLKEGETFPLTLSFERAGDVQVAVRVERAGAMGADAADHGSMQMHDGMEHGGMK
jgi:copper(I)-binding protein